MMRSPHRRSSDLASENLVRSSLVQCLWMWLDVDVETQDPLVLHPAMADTKRLDMTHQQSWVVVARQDLLGTRQ